MRILVECGCGANLGDLAMLQAVLLRLRHLFPAAQLTASIRPQVRGFVYPGLADSAVDLSGVRPVLFGALEKVPFFWRFQRQWNDFFTDLDLRSTAAVSSPASHLGLAGGAVIDRLARDFDALHVVGGGNLTAMFPREVFRKCSLVLAFRRRRKPALFTGQQLGPLSGLPEKTVHAALRESCFVGVREPTDSVSVCERAGLAPDRYAVMGDDSFGLPSPPQSQVREVLDRYGLKEGGFLALNIRLASYGVQQGALRTVATLLREVRDLLKMPLVAVPIALGTGESDSQAATQLAALAPDLDLTIINGEELTPALARAVLGKAHAGLGTSYHFCTFALCEGVPAICLHEGAYYGQKARGLCGFWGDDRLAFSLAQADPAAAARDLVQALEDQQLRAKIRQRSREAMAEWRLIFDQQVHAAFGGLL